MNVTTPLPRVEVASEKSALTSRAGTALLRGLSDKPGLTEGLSGALRCHSRKVRHEPGRVARDVAVMLVDGGDCLSDLGALRDQGVLFGALASDATAYRCLERLGGEGFGLHPLLGFEAASGEALADVLHPENPGANTDLHP